MVHVAVDGKPFTDFVLRGGNAMKPYLWPLRSASGKEVTRKFPMDPTSLEGEPKDHPHQRGLWFAHARVNDCDFWNNESDYKTPARGKIVVTKISDVKNGAEEGSFRAEMDWVDHKEVTCVTETRLMTFRKKENLRIIDLDVTLAARVNATFADAKDGTVGIRLAAALEEPNAGPPGSGNTIIGTGLITNAEGETSKAVWGKVSKWMDVSGMVDGETVGVTVFDHPENPRPVHWHVRDYGLLAGNPFGLKVFSGDKNSPLDGSIVLKPGDTLRFRYRVVIHAGDAKAVEGAWGKF